MTERLDIERVLTDQSRRDLLLQRVGNGRVVPALRGFAQPDQSLVGAHAYELPLAALRYCHAVDGDVGDLHGEVSAPRMTGTRAGRLATAAGKPGRRRAARRGRAPSSAAAVV